MSYDLQLVKRVDIQPNLQFARTDIDPIGDTPTSEVCDDTEICRENCLGAIKIILLLVDDPDAVIREL